VPAEVVGFRAGRTLLMPLGEMHAASARARASPPPAARCASTSATSCSAACSTASAARSTARARSAPGRRARADEAAPPDPLERPRIDERVSLGVRALDALVPCGRGQRLGIFAGSGVGKSSLLGMIARSTSADVNVICLVGERGREVREFIERDLGPRAWRARSSSSPPPTSRRSCASRPRSPPPRSPSTSATRAAT
jgi:flagellum-specific ATP synthase